MIIDISLVANSINKSMEKEAAYGPDTFSSKLGDFPVIQKSPVKLRITNQEKDKLLIQGEADLVLCIPCDRCLEKVPTSIHLDIDRTLVLKDNCLCDEEMEETDYLIGFNLDVDKLVYAEILVNWPMKVLCRDDCKGICRVCGKNLNHGACSCDRFVPDPRMAAFQDIFKQFKEV